MPIILERDCILLFLYSFGGSYIISRRTIMPFMGGFYIGAFCGVVFGWFLCGVFALKKRRDIEANLAFRKFRLMEKEEELASRTSWQNDAVANL